VRVKTSLHDTIRADFAARIRAGELEPGDRLPTEAELCEAYGCSRMTVNKALTALAAEGLVERRKRAGTLVAHPRVHAMVLDVPDLAARVRAEGQAYAFELLACSERSPQRGEAGEVALAAGGRLLALDGLHRANGRPLAVEHRLVSLAAVPAMREAALGAEGLGEDGPGTWLLRHIPWTEAETRITAAGATREEAALLGVAAGHACLCIERRTWRGDEAITLVRQVFPGELYDLVARFGP
jgi:GntR family histidine utilization transcriptional repressor